MNFEAEHTRNLAAVERRLEDILERISTDLPRLVPIYIVHPHQRKFSFSATPELKTAAEKVLEDFRTAVMAAISEAVKTSDNISAAKRNDFAHAYGVPVATALSTAAETFAERRVGKLTLSDRVWALSEGVEETIETAIGVALEEGTSANNLASQIQKYLKNPEKNPGRGVYRDVFASARRLAATEVNIAYHRADLERWRGLDFVLGYEVETSGTNPNICPICIELAGRYPKDFDFVGWHPHCRCHSIPVLESVEDFKARRAADRTAPPKGVIEELPENFTRHLEKNTTRIRAARARGTLPFFIRDNFKTHPSGELSSVWGTLVPAKDITEKHRFIPSKKK